MFKTDLNNRFSYHPPTQEQVVIYEQTRVYARELAYHLNDAVPEGREKSLAMTHLEEVVFWANAGIARAVAAPDVAAPARHYENRAATPAESGAAVTGTT